MQQSDQQDDKLFKKKNAKKRMVIQSQSQSQSQQSQMIKKRQILKELKKQELSFPLFLLQGVSLHWSGCTPPGLPSFSFTGVVYSKIKCGKQFTC